jgi:hypothetical protein
MTLADHVILNFNNNMSTAAVFLDIEKAFATRWHTGLLYKLSELESSHRIKLIASFLTNRNFKVFVEGEFSTPREIAAAVPQDSVHAPILYRLCVYKRRLSGNRNSSRSIRRRYLYLRDRET